MFTLDTYLGHVQRLYVSAPTELVQLISFDSEAAIVQQLSQLLNSTPALRSTSYTSHARSFFSDSRPFADLIAAYLLFCRDAPPPDEADDPNALNTSYSLLEDCYKQADKLFAQGDSAWVVPILRSLTLTLIQVALKAGTIMGDRKLIKAGEAARLLSRPMGVAASDRSKETPSKRSALFFLVNSTFKVYFAMHNLRLCDTILSNTSNAVGGSFSEERYYPKSDRVTFAYYRGRVWLYQRRLPLARNELRKALGLVEEQAWGNTRLILIYLIAASLPLGILPTVHLLQEYDLDDQYEGLLLALTVSDKGNYVQVLAELDRHRAWHLSKGNYLLLKEKLQVICWRNLVRTTTSSRLSSLLIMTHGKPLPPSGPPTLSLNALVVTARIAFGDQSLDLDDVEGMCTSLMDQGYLKAYIMHSKALLVLQKSATFGFPPISSVHP
ncbi:BZ3500_MvSof-1268-A1-R1_Chr2-1g04581 [Microbotryum saponariae]|uniref:BZ3500_MvSof-1268-A1-R1_Chr2-1g04581 protein n=1 Tax=Microbotryum saponariae TaxID=289078 RepID=A0A2X0MD38_9BASI|nr:BZ3500_MvSof-1268-A1-R1_Chr2-1g04581 [Microbotryum saponariae]SCZ92080.1 BZ3501_MvSof-1269-A2-R1_Chr2-1g04237 [Microbotryum saponariae]